MVLLMNLITIHGVSNCFVDELFAIMQGHLLPLENCLPQNYYAAKSLIQKLSLSYNSIYACVKGCVLFRGKLTDAVGRCYCASVERGAGSGERGF